MCSFTLTFGPMSVQLMSIRWHWLQSTFFRSPMFVLVVTWSTAGWPTLPPFLIFSEWPSGSMAAARWCTLIYSLKMVTSQKVSALSLVSPSALFFSHSSKAIPVQVLSLQRLPEGQPEDPRPLCPPQALWQQPVPGSPPPTLAHAPEALQIASEYHRR